VNLLALDMQSCAAGSQDLQRRAALQEDPDKGGDLGEQMLTVVDEEQDLLRAQPLHHLLDEVVIWRWRKLDGRGHRHSEQGGIADWRQINPGHTIGKEVSCALRNGEGEAGLPDPTRTCQCQERDGFIQEQ
jgi:hypothetical protein